MATLVVAHVVMVVSLARPVPPRRVAPGVEPVERIQLVAITAPPATPPWVRRPQAMVDPAPSQPARTSNAPVRPITGAGVPPSGIPSSPLPPARVRDAAGDAPASFRRPTNGTVLRGPVRARIPGTDAPIVEGFHVRETPSIEDRVIQVTAMVFGGGRPETCDDVRQRLIGAGPGLARDMDVERLKRLCTQ